MKVTYLFGAGASSATIPLSDELGSDIGATADAMKISMIPFYSQGQTVYPEEHRPPPQGSYGRSLFEAMEWLCKTALNHNSVDTIARKLWMRANAESKDTLERLKATLTAYLWYKQISQPSDRRYDTFLATVLQKNPNQLPTLPAPVRLLTWNYDLLFERSLYEFCLDYRHVREYLLERRGIVHLNGYASVSPRVPASLLSNDLIKFEHSLFVGTTDNFAQAIELFERSTKFHPADQLVTKIAFAWENSELVDAAAETVRDTTILVVVGYSFPYFNRAADRTILSRMAPTISRLSLQVGGDPGPRERLLSILNEINVEGGWNKRIQEVEDSKQIAIPNELIQ